MKAIVSHAFFGIDYTKYGWNMLISVAEHSLAESNLMLQGYLLQISMPLLQWLTRCDRQSVKDKGW